MLFDNDTLQIILDFCKKYNFSFNPRHDRNDLFLVERNGECQLNCKSCRYTHGLLNDFDIQNRDNMIVEIKKFAAINNFYCSIGWRNRDQATTVFIREKILIGDKYY
jgi:hypothetical protein